MYPTKEEIFNIVRICLVEEETLSPVRIVWTENPEMYLKMYYFAWYNNIDIDLEVMDENEDKYCDMIGNVQDIEIKFGDKNTFTSVNIIVKLRNYK